MAKYYSVCVDGIDRTGKNTLHGFIDYLSGRNYIITDRGILTQIAFSHLYNRDFNYELDSQKYIVNVLLTIDKEDWEIRCKMTNEPKISYEANQKVFDDAYKVLQKTGYPLLTFNTSKQTPYQIAKEIVKYVESLNE